MQTKKCFFGYCNVISYNNNHCYHTNPILQVEVEQKTTEWTALWVYRAEDLSKITSEYRNMLTIDYIKRSDIRSMKEELCFVLKKLTLHPQLSYYEAYQWMTVHSRNYKALLYLLLQLSRGAHNKV